MSDDSDEKRSSPWRWPAEWMSEEKFWRDIGTRVLAGVVTAAIVYLGALVLGYLHTPEIGAGVTIALAAIAVVLLLAGVAALVVRLPSRARAGRPIAARIVVAALLVVVAVALVLGVAADLSAG
ncbi:hypothetical protein [Herbiconiux sp.]|uniref:hypothetical protein n=1 Tax=Herbiconiux sp. TaxID=1871186 RepID=UPI0025C0B7C7|nr:hypothetical protein [Herbiconiux sp.]